VLTVTVRRNETIDKAIRRLKKKVDREGILKLVRQHAFYEKPSEKKLRKQKNARRNAQRMIRLAGF
jgi:small subunit ribosomal protein S21